MPRTKTQSQPSWPGLPDGPMPDVLTLSEAAGYLRLPEAEVVSLIRDKGLPAQQVGSEWRLLLAAIRDWLRMGPARNSSKEAWMELAGVWRDDPHFQDLLREIDQGTSGPIAEDRA